MHAFGDQFPIRGYRSICIVCASLVLIRTQPLDSGQELIFSNLSEVGIEPVTSMIKNR